MHGEQVVHSGEVHIAKTADHIRFHHVDHAIDQNIIADMNADDFSENNQIGRILGRSG